MRALTSLAALVAAGCASRSPAPPAPPAVRTADLTLLRLGQPFLDGALEVSRWSPSRTREGLSLAVTVTNASGTALDLRWRFRYIDAEGWELRGARTAEWKSVTLPAGGEWSWDGPAELPEAEAAGMDWRRDRDAAK